MGMPVTQGKEATLSYLAGISTRAELVDDPVLRSAVRLTIRAIQDNPEAAAALRQRHLASLAAYFMEIGKKQLDDGDLPTAVQAAQLAMRCNPTNPRVRLFYADLLHRRLGKTEDAISLLKNNLRTEGTLDNADRAVLERLAQLLQTRHRDPEVVDIFRKILASSDLDQETRNMAAFQLATSLYWTGKYPEAVALIETHQLDRSISGVLLLALAYFDGGKVQQALGVLDNRASDFKGAERDALLAQHGRLLMVSKQPRQALSIIDDRISLDAQNGFLRVQRLAILTKLGMNDEADRELQALLQRFADNDAVLLALANFGSQRGAVGLCENLANLAIARGFDTATFSALHLESLIRAGQPELALRTYLAVNQARPGHFRSNQSMVQALLGIAYTLRPKSDEPGKKADASIAEKHFASFVAEEPGPEAFRSVASHLMAGGAPEPAARILSLGVAAHPWHTQLRADWVAARILAGQGEARGTRTALVDEAERLLAGRRPIPTIWSDLLAWVRSEANLEASQRRRLEAALEPLIRPDLDREAFLGR
jgi:Flp pilus assembly protein TadD